jgi:hypothetical protein
VAETAIDLFALAWEICMWEFPVSILKERTDKPIPQLQIKTYNLLLLLVNVFLEGVDVIQTSWIRESCSWDYIVYLVQVLVPDNCANVGTSNSDIVTNCNLLYCEYSVSSSVNISFQISSTESSQILKCLVMQNHYRAVSESHIVDSKVIIW